MEEPQTQSVEFDVNLPKSRPVSLLAKIIFGVGVLAVVGAIAAVVISRTASPAVDPTVKVMPADTMLLMSLNTHPDKLSNYNVVAEAWKGSKEAKQLESGLQLAIMQAGFNWEDDIQSWLGERATIGIVDLGGATQNSSTSPQYRAPFFLAALETRDRAKSDAFLVNVRKELESKIKPNDYMTTTIRDDNYRGIAIVYVTTETRGSGVDKSTVNDAAAYATINDVIVATTSADNLKKAIDAALDGNNLAQSANYQTTMSTLPDQTAFAAYMDFNRYMKAMLDMTMGISTQMSATFDNIYSNLDVTPDPDLLKQQAEQKRQREEALRKQQAQMQKLQETLQAMGGMGVAMTYESTGIRFDAVVQFDLAKVPEAQRQMYEASYKSAANKVFDSIPALTMAALNGNNPAAYLKSFTDPNLPDPFSNFPGMQDGTFRDKIAEFEKLAGVNLNADLLDLLNGEFAFVVIPKAQSISDNPTARPNLPFEVALMLDSSDAARVSGSVDKILQTISTQSGGEVQQQSLSGLPYSVLLDGKGNPILAYGVVDGRLVVGSSSETLLGLQNAKQSPLSADATFKAATGMLPATRTQTGYFNLQPLWAWLETQAPDRADVSGVLNYLRPFKWVSTGSGVPTDKLVRSEVHIGVGK